jgi:hypothetical protein
MPIKRKMEVRSEVGIAGRGAKTPSFTPLLSASENENMSRYAADSKRGPQTNSHKTMK